MKNVVITLVLIGCISMAYSQKMPQIQMNPLFLSFNPKMDGNADEWNNKFQAFNRTNHVYYSVANDAKYFYLILSAADGFISEKALYGVVLTINLPSEGALKARELSVTFPKHSDSQKKTPLGF